MPNTVSSSVFLLEYQMDRGYCGRKVQTVAVIIAGTGTKARRNVDKCVAPVRQRAFRIAQIDLPLDNCRKGPALMDDCRIVRQEANMFDHISIGVRDIRRSRRFYDAALTPLGYRLLSESESSLGYGTDKVMLWLLKTESPVPADPRSGLHFAFVAPDVRSVGEFYIAALDSGGTDNGAPGERHYHPGYYGAFVLDPDGNNIEAVHHGPAERSAASVVLTPKG
jgi:catechol 2,3-dioxygenase-like lactoylglutathione lyase family enzyme